jgi:hypothetical protein
MLNMVKMPSEMLRLEKDSRSILQRPQVERQTADHSAD